MILNTLVRPTKVPLIFTLIFRTGGFSSFLIRRLDLFRKMAFSGMMIRRGLDPRAKAEYTARHPKAADRGGIAAFPKMIPDHPGHADYQYV